MTPVPLTWTPLMFPIVPPMWCEPSAIGDGSRRDRLADSQRNASISSGKGEAWFRPLRRYRIYSNRRSGMTQRAAMSGGLLIRGPEPDGDEPEDDDTGGEGCLGHASGVYPRPETTDALRCPGLWHVAPPFERERWLTSPGGRSRHTANRRKPRARWLNAVQSTSCLTAWSFRSQKFRPQPRRRGAGSAMAQHTPDTDGAVSTPIPHLRETFGAD